MGVPRFIFSLGALPYDHMTRHAHWKAHCASMVPHFPPGARRRVLDIGCGPGVSTLAFRRVAPDDTIIGADVSAAMLERARRNDPEASCAWMRADALALPLPDESLDVVTGHSFLYLVPDRTAALAELRRVLRPGGRLVLLEPHRQGVRGDLRSLWKTLRAVGPWFTFTMSCWRVAAALGGAFRPGDLEALLSEAGFVDPVTRATLEGLGYLATASR